jgi:hypothetical protein
LAKHESLRKEQRFRLTDFRFYSMMKGMDAKQTIAEIEWLERIFAVPDTRPLTSSDLSAANRRHDEMLANSPWFRIWQQYGVCCRAESPAIQLGEIDS